MIRLVHLLRRRPNLSRDAFERAFDQVRGPLIAGLQSDLGILRYTQCIREQTQGEDDAALAARIARGGMAPPYDGVAEYWFSSETALIEATRTEAGRVALDRLIDQEADFSDPASSPLWLAREHPQVSMTYEYPVARLKSGVLKLHLALAPHSHMPPSAAADYWLHEHGPLVRSWASARGMLRYQQVHRIESAWIDTLNQRRGHASNVFIGHAEAWFDRLSATAGPEAQSAATAAMEDERAFIDWDRSTAWTSKERVFVHFA